jgi:hypothetical protein
MWAVRNTEDSQTRHGETDVPGLHVQAVHSAKPTPTRIQLIVTPNVTSKDRAPAAILDADVSKPLTLPPYRIGRCVGTGGVQRPQ